MVYSCSFDIIVGDASNEKNCETSLMEGKKSGCSLTLHLFEFTLTNNAGCN